MRSHLFTITACLLWAYGSAAHAADYNFKPGLWETTFTMEMTGMPAGMPSMPPQTQRHCVRPQDAEFIPRREDPKSNCTFKTKRVGRNKLTWTMSCDNKGGVSKGHGEITYKGNTSSGYSEVSMSDGPAGPMAMKQTFTSRRVGDCR